MVADKAQKERSRIGAYFLISMRMTVITQSQSIHNAQTTSSFCAPGAPEGKAYRTHGAGRSSAGTVCLAPRPCQATMANTERRMARPVVITPSGHHPLPVGGHPAPCPAPSHTDRTRPPEECRHLVTAPLPAGPSKRGVWQRARPHQNRLRRSQVRP